MWCRHPCLHEHSLHENIDAGGAACGVGRLHEHSLHENIDAGGAACGVGRLHNGDIQLTNRSDCGTCASLFLPVEV